MNLSSKQGQRYVYVLLVLIFTFSLVGASVPLAHAQPSSGTAPSCSGGTYPASSPTPAGCWCATETTITEHSSPVTGYYCTSSQSLCNTYVTSEEASPGYGTFGGSPTLGTCQLSTTVVQSTSPSNPTPPTTPVVSSGFVPLAGIPGLTEGVVANSTGLISFLNNLYKYLIGLAAVLAVFEIIWGGLEIATQDALPRKADGKKRIYNAIWGLILILSPVIIFTAINPNILDLTVNIPPLPTPSGPPGQTSGGLQTSGSNSQQVNNGSSGTQTGSQQGSGSGNQNTNSNNTDYSEGY